MNHVIKDLINKKVNSLTLKDLIRLSHQEGIPLTVKEGKKVLEIIHQQPFDISDKKKVNELKQKLQKEFPKHSQSALALLKQYEHYLD
ncbi:Protein of unknown function [Salipaludibacillus aurantiacus]|uniref:DUF2624 domain-containing protein n=1 Tax=Salipaludibacillus aurantiacus TaxID=1601833 RepID=A0A1H9RAA1_9BACI|nr:Protein of unknown function [Salipaludibacillus aurantiacus]